MRAKPVIARKNHKRPWAPSGQAEGTHGLIDAYVAHRVARGDFAGSSAVVVRVVLSNFAHFLGDRPLASATEGDVSAWLTRTITGVGTFRSRLFKLRPFARWLVKQGVVTVDFTGDISPPRANVGLPRCLPTDAVARLYDACPDTRARLIVALMVQCGLRCAEVASIRTSDVDRQRRLIAVRGKGGRGETSRAVPIPAEAWNELVAYEAECEPSWSGPLVFSFNPPHDALTPQTVSKLMGKTMSAAGLKTCAYDGVSAHALRHTAAQDVLDAGADIRHVQAMLGHHSLRTTQEYLRLNPARPRRGDGRPHLPARSVVTAASVHFRSRPPLIAAGAASC